MPLPICVVTELTLSFQSPGISASRKSLSPVEAVQSLMMTSVSPVLLL
ncbi:hypothetical protein [Streptomyces sp. NBC_00076]